MRKSILQARAAEKQHACKDFYGKYCIEIEFGTNGYPKCEVRETGRRLKNRPCFNHLKSLPSLAGSHGLGCDLVTTYANLCKLCNACCYECVLLRKLGIICT